MAKATTNKMSPKAEHPTSQAPKYNRSRSKLLLESEPPTRSTVAASTTTPMKTTPLEPELSSDPSTKSTHSNHGFHIIADMAVDRAPRQRLIPFRPRGHFIASLVKVMPRGPLIPNDTLGLPMIRYNHFDQFSLTSATEYTISLFAKICIHAGASATLLGLPVELRLKIYELAFEGHWKNHKENRPLSARELFINVYAGCMPEDELKAWSKDQPKVKPELVALEPPILRACKLFRQEGIGEYQRFLQAICDAQQEREAALSRDREEPYDCWGRLTEIRRLLEMGFPKSPTNEEEWSARNAEKELKRLRRVEQRAAKKARRRPKCRKGVKRNETPDSIPAIETVEELANIPEGNGLRSSQGV